MTYSPYRGDFAEPDFKQDFMAVMQYLTSVNVDRCKNWHGENGLNDWSALEWAGAMCGEAGEAANVAKKLKREQTGMPNRLSAGSESDLRAKLAKEAADTFLYLNLMCAREGISLAAAIIDVFNQKSTEYNFPQRL